MYHDWCDEFGCCVRFACVASSGEKCRRARFADAGGVFDIRLWLGCWERLADTFIPSLL